MTTPGALPTLGNIDDAGNILSAPMNFPIGPWPFFDGSAVVFVRQNAVRGGLKFGELLRRREVGRLPSKFESYSAGSYGFERFASRRGAFAGCEARKVMSPARIGELALTSPSRARNCRLPVYIECPNRIQTWESVWIAAPCAGSSGRWTNAVGECPHHSPPSFRLALQKVPAVGELPLAVRRGFLSRCSEDFLCRICAAPEGSRLTAGKAGKKVRGDMKGKLATSDELARSVSIFGAALLLLLGGHFASNRTARG
jgi:hypothetical protein